MASIFISSVISGFGEFRAAAKEAVELMGEKPVMAEQFGARPYSSETACLSEVEGSDVYLLILGERYGYITDDGVSVAESEFRMARQLDKPILVFSQRCEMEEQQQKFRDEVEHYHGGFFRAAFSTPAELKDAVIKGLRQLEARALAIPVSDFEERVNRARGQLPGNRDEAPELVLAFLPQPERSMDIVGLEENLDQIFGKLARTGLTHLRLGYEVKTGPDFTGLTTNNLGVAVFADSLTLLVAKCSAQGDGIFAGHFVPPSVLRDLALGFKQLLSTYSGYMRMELRFMDNAYVADLPTGNSMTMKMWGDAEGGLTKLFAPMTDSGYLNWVSQCIGRFERMFEYK